MVFRIILFVMAYSLLTGCSSSRWVASDAEISGGDRYLYVSTYYTGYEERHLGEVVRLFEKYGFSPTNDKASANYQLGFNIAGGGIVTVNILLNQGLHTLLEAKASNAGWGTAVARPAAIA